MSPPQSDEPSTGARADEPGAAAAAPPDGDGRPSVLTRALGLLGPGVISGAADDDPTGVATYAQAGAQTGYGLLWTALLTFPMMVTVQYMAAKIALIHQQGLAGVIRANYPRPVLLAAVGGLTLANVINAGADIGAIAAAINLVVPVPIALLVVPVAAFILLFLVFGSFHLIEDVFKWLALALLAYVVSSVLAHPDVGQMLKGTFLPSFHLGGAYLTLVVAGLGGNVSPYLFFWQADLEATEEREEPPVRRRRLRLDAELKHVAWGTVVGMIFSNIIIYFIEVASAATLHREGHTNVQSAAEAARALRPLLGNTATVLWAVGMIGAGLLAVPALTGSIADAVSESFGWPFGLEEKLGRAKRFYAVLAVAMGVAALINFVGINPIQALVLAGALNGILTPPLLVLMLLIARRKDVMGEHTNGRGLNALGWATTVIMGVAAAALIVTML